MESSKITFQQIQDGKLYDYECVNPHCKIAVTLTFPLGRCPECNSWKSWRSVEMNLEKYAMRILLEDGKGAHACLDKFERRLNRMEIYANDEEKIEVLSRYLFERLHHECKLAFKSHKTNTVISVKRLLECRVQANKAK